MSNSVRCQVLAATSVKMTVFWKFRPRSLSEMVISSLGRITLMMEPVSTSETSVDFYQTPLPNMSEDSHLQFQIFLFLFNLLLIFFVRIGPELFQLNKL
jgi:hypothetical protein